MSAIFVAGGGSPSTKAATFRFGKHKGRTFQEVIESDKGYCDWALRQEDPSGQLKDFIQLVQEHGVKGQPASEARKPGGNAPWQRNAGNAATPQRAAYPKAGGVGGSSGSTAQPTPMMRPVEMRLHDDTTLVLELGEAHVAVRAERSGQQPGTGSGASAFLPPHIWHSIGKLEGARLCSDRRTWLFPVRSQRALAESLAGFGRVEAIPGWVARLVEVADKAGDSLRSELLPERLMPYQLDGVRFGVSHRGRCLIGDEMGLGKTLQALAIAAQYVEEWPVLVVCPSSLRWVWKEQLQQWLPNLVKDGEAQVITKRAEHLDPRAKFWIISYNILSQDAKECKFQQRPDGSPHGVIIADESHNIKEWSAARTKVVVGLLRKAKRAMLLSGTPTRNSADELHPQLCGLLPSFTVKIAEFRERYCQIQQQMIGGGRTVSKVVGSRNATELNQLLAATVMVRRLKKDVLDQLPEKRRQKIPIEVSDAKLMRDIRGEMQALTGMMSGGGSEGHEPAPIMDVFQRLAKARVPAVKEYLQEVLDRGDEKAIVFAHHRLVMDEISELLQKQLTKDGLTHVRIDGKTPGPKRQELVKKFQEDPACRIALLSITACGEGLTLTAAGLVIFAELYWVPGAVEQAEARAHRIGTTKSKVIVEFLVVPNSPDEHIYNMLERKKKDTSHVLDGAAASLNVQHVARKRPAPEEGSPLAARAAGEPGFAGEGAGDAADRKRTRKDMALDASPPGKRSSVLKLLRGEE